METKIEWALKQIDSYLSYEGNNQARNALKYAKRVIEKLDERVDEDAADSIQPAHYNKGDIDLYEAAYLTRPFNEFRAILEFTAERYIKRDKNDRVEDISKAIYTLERLKEYEEKERAND